MCAFCRLPPLVPCVGKYVAKAVFVSFHLRSFHILHVCIGFCYYYGFMLHFLCIEIMSFNILTFLCFNCLHLKVFNFFKLFKRFLWFFFGILGETHLKRKSDEIVKALQSNLEFYYEEYINQRIWNPNFILD